jgi:cytoskeletal protein CcmA (bactofilin family)
MALFSKKPDRVLRIQPAHLPQPPALPSEPSQATHPSSTEEPACLGRGSKVSGKVTFVGSGRIDCELDGEVTAKNRLYIGQLAIVTAKIRAASIIVAGSVRGDITGSQKIELRPSAKVIGNLSAPVVILQEGARFEGQCSMPEPTREERKVTMFQKEQRSAQTAEMSTSEEKPFPAKNPRTNAM